MGYTYNN